MYNTLRVHEPAAPFSFINPHTMHALDRRLTQGIHGRQADDNLHRLLVDVVAGRDFLGVLRDAHFQQGGVGVGGVLARGHPVADGREFVGDDQWGDVSLGPGLNAEDLLTVWAVEPPRFGERGEVGQAEIVEVDEERLRVLFG